MSVERIEKKEHANHTHKIKSISKEVKGSFATSNEVGYYTS